MVSVRFNQVTICNLFDRIFITDVIFIADIKKPPYGGFFQQRSINQVFWLHNQLLIEQL